MPGRMGGKRRTVHSLRVVKIDTMYNLLYVKGCLPGAAGSVVRVRDAKRRLWHGQCFPEQAHVPFPTYIPGMEEITAAAASRSVAAMKERRQAVGGVGVDVSAVGGELAAPRELLPPPPKEGTKDPMSRARREVEK
jgi:hypothetical protein